MSIISECSRATDDGLGPFYERYSYTARPLWADMSPAMPLGPLTGLSLIENLFAGNTLGSVNVASATGITYGA